MLHATTILAYKGKNKSVIGGDGQVSLGNMIIKGNAVKIRKLNNDKVLAGFAGSTTDAFNLFDMLGNLFQSSRGDLPKTVTDFSKEWHKDKYLRRLEAMILVLGRKRTFLLSGTGNVLEPEDNQIATIRSGRNYTLSAARALKEYAQDLDEEEFVKPSLQIIDEICVYMNTDTETYIIEDER